MSVATPIIPKNGTKRTLEIPQPNPHAVQDAWLAQARKKVVKARLLDGKAIVGVLDQWDTFTLTLRPIGQAVILVYKQSVAYMSLGADGEAKA